MTTKKTIGHGEVLFTADGVDDVERGSEKVGAAVESTADSAETAEGGFRSWADSFLELNKRFDEHGERAQGFFKATDRIFSVTGAATNAITLLGFAGEGLAAIYELVTGASEEAERQSEELTEALRKQEEQSEEAARAAAALASILGRNQLDQSVAQTLEYIDAQRELALATEQYNDALGKRAAFEQHQLETDGALVKFDVAKQTRLDQERERVVKLGQEYDAASGSARRRALARLNESVATVRALEAEQKGLDQTLDASRESVAAAEDRIAVLKAEALDLQQRLDAENQLIIAQAEKDAKTKGAAKSAAESAAVFSEAFSRAGFEVSRAFAIAGDALGEFEEQVEARLRADAFIEANLELLEELGETALGFGDTIVEAFTPVDDSFAQLQKRAEETERAFVNMASGIGASAAAALVDVVLFGQDAAKAVNALANAALHEAAIGAALEGAKALVRLAVGDFAGASMHGAAAAAYTGVAVVAGVAASATGGVGGGAPSAGGGAPSPDTDSDRGFTRRNRTADEGAVPIEANFNFYSGNRRPTRRERAEYADDVRQTLTGRSF